MFTHLPYLATVIMFCAAFHLGAQGNISSDLPSSVRVTKSAFNLDLKRPNILDVVEKADKRAILLISSFRGARSSKGFYLQRLSPEGVEELSVEVVLPDDDKSISIKQIAVIEDKLYLITTSQDKKQEKKYLYAQEYSSETLTPTGQRSQLSETVHQQSSFNLLAPFAESVSLNWFSVMVTRDGKHLIVRTTASGTKKEEGSLRLQAFDANLKETGVLQPMLPGSELGGIKILRTLVTNNLTVLLAIEIPRKPKARDKRPAPQLTVLKTSFKSPKEEFIPIQIDERYRMGGLNFSLLDQETLSVSGRYADPNNFSVGLGYFHKEINIFGEEQSAGILIPIVSNAADKSLTTWGIYSPSSEEDVKRKRQKTITDWLSVAQVIKATDGGKYIVGYQSYATIKKEARLDIVVNHLRNVIVARLDESGGMNWVQIVPVHHKGYWQAPLGLIVTEEEGNLRLLFNDSEQNKGDFTSPPSNKKNENTSFNTRIVVLDDHGVPKEYTPATFQSNRVYYSYNSIYSPNTKRFYTLTKEKKRGKQVFLKTIYF